MVFAKLRWKSLCAVANISREDLDGLWEDPT